MSGAWSLSYSSRRGQDVLGVQLDVVFTDASARAAAVHAVDVHSNFARQSSHVRRGGNRIAMLRAGDFSQLHGHGERRSRCIRLIGWQCLLFGLALGFHRHLERQARRLLS